MKVCPVCKSRCFDDMDTCYGCMYRFETQGKTKEEQIGFPAENSYVEPAYSMNEVEQVHVKQPAYAVSSAKPISQWNKVPISDVTLPEKSWYVPEYHETEDNVNRYLMLEDVDDFLSRRLVNDDLTIVEQRMCTPKNSASSNACQTPVNNFQVDQARLQNTNSNPVCKTLTLTLEIPQEAMSMLVC